MDLWNEYEGKMIAEKYPLEKLIYPEGRSGFFLTSNGTGAAAVIRLTETLNDEAEILAQWRAVIALNEPNLVTLRSCGETVIDDAPLTYAVMERADATLAEILRERPMTVDETRQIAASVVLALKALHKHGLVHRHLDPSSVVAIGETIKLRSDCVQTIGHPDEAAKLKGRDVHDLAILLLECLTQKRVQTAELRQLPDPFGEIIGHGLTGAWSLEDIAKALAPAASSVPAPVTNKVEVESEGLETSVPASSTNISLAPEAEVPKGGDTMPSFNAKAEPHASISARDRNLLIVTVAVTIVIVLWLFVHLITGHTQETASQGLQGSAVVTNSAAVPAAPGLAPNPAPATGSRSVISAPSNDASWRIVAYSFRREADARKKAEALLRKHPWIDPQVIEPTGRLPYLVTLGGRMTRGDAAAFEQKLHAQHFHHAIHLEEIRAN